jgi:general stress protein 26
MTRRAAVLALVCLSLRAALHLPETAWGETGEREKIVSAAREVMQKARFCTLVTLGRDGHPQARIVDPLAPEPDMTVWIATNPITRKVAEVRASPRVTLLYFDPSGPAYVTLLATAELVTDSSERARHWKQDWAPFYKDGHRGDDFVLIRTKPTRLELVSQGHGIVNDPVSWRPTTIEFP